MKEVTQLHEREVFAPILISELTEEEKRKAQEVLLLLTEKRDESVKGRGCYNGAPTRAWIGKEDTSSPTVFTESIHLLAAIDAWERRDNMTSDVPNAFVQTDLPKAEVGERVTVKVTGPLVELLMELDPQRYKNFIVYEKGRPVIYLVVLKALYGMLVASLLWYQKFRKDLESIGLNSTAMIPVFATEMSTTSSTR